MYNIQAVIQYYNYIIGNKKMQLSERKVFALVMTVLLLILCSYTSSKEEWIVFAAS